MAVSYSRLITKFSQIERLKATVYIIYKTFISQCKCAVKQNQIKFSNSFKIIIVRSIFGFIDYIFCLLLYLQ